MLDAVTSPVDDLMRRAIKARQRAQTAVGEAVREAQAAGWSWARMSSALGGTPSAETLRRTFAGREEAGDRAAGSGCAGRGCGCGDSGPCA